MTLGNLRFSRFMYPAVAIAFVFTQAGWSQERTGSLEGIISDPSGAAVSSAAVEISSPSLLQPMKLLSDSAGAYQFPSLPPGNYRLSISAPGFRQYQAAAVPVNVGRVSRVDVRLEVGQVTESVVVTADAIQVDTASTTVATNVTETAYDRLPKGRSFDSLVILSPGVRAEPKSGGYQVDGSSGSENAYILDGIEVTSIQTGILPGQARVPIEWIAETQVKSSGFSAEYGGAIGGVVAATTRSGSNSFHGQGSLYWSGDVLNARPRMTQRLNPNDDSIAEYFHDPKDSMRFLNPGFRLGGPIKRDFAWFFVSGYPQFTKRERDVTYLRPAETRHYEQRERQDFTLAKIDVQPFSKLRGNFSYFYNPLRVNGLLPTYQGTDAITNPWADRGYRRPATGYGWSGDYSATSKLMISAFGGYQYSNYKDYGIPRGTFFLFASPSTSLTGVPDQFRAASGNFTPNNRQTVQDIYTRHTAHIVGSYLLNAAGQHNLRFGYDLNRLANKPNAGTWPDGYVRVLWDREYAFVTKPGRARGTYGYYINRAFATEGDVTSNNTGLFINDAWRVSRKLTLNLGIRTEREFLPSFDPTIQAKPIEFGFGSKIAPRFGFAYDPTGQGRMRFAASWGMYYDIMKYEMPRGSFGGDKWLDFVYTLDNPNILAINPGGNGFGNCQCPGTFLEQVNWRIPSHDPAHNLIDPDLKPVRLQSWNASWDINFASDYVFGVRYVHRQLDRTIEDVGILTSQGEQYYIANPGFGLTIDPASFEAGYPANVTPKAKRNYDAVEFRLERSFARRASFQAAYIVSRLYGNYAGLANSDENGRTSPNVNRVYDLPWMAYDERGQLVYGRLATDRPHAFKFFGAYDWKTKVGTTRFSPIFQAASGAPLSTEVAVNHVPVFAYGRGDLGRTAAFTQTDLLVSHDIPTGGEGRFIRVELNVINLFNHGRELSRYTGLDHVNDGGINLFTDQTARILQGYNSRSLITQQGIRLDPRYNLANQFQDPRALRFGFHFFF